MTTRSAAARLVHTAALGLVAWPKLTLPQSYAASYAGGVLLPALHSRLDSVMETPFETLRFSEAVLECEHLAQRSNHL